MCRFLSLYTISRIKDIVEIDSAFIVCPIDIDIFVCNNPVHPDTRFILFVCFHFSNLPQTGTWQCVINNILTVIDFKDNVEKDSS